MENDKGQKVGSNYGAETSTQKISEENITTTGRPDINEINKRNAEQEKQERKSSYTVAGIAALLIALIAIAIYYFG